MRLKDIPIWFVWEDRGIPTAVYSDGGPGMLVTSLQAALPFLPRPMLAEGAGIFGRQFALDLRLALWLITQDEDAKAGKTDYKAPTYSLSDLKGNP